MFDLIKKKQEYKLNLYCIKGLMFTKNYNIKVKNEIDGKKNIYFRCIACGFKKFTTIDEEELADLLKYLI